MATPLMRAYNVFASGPKFTKCFSLNVAGAVVDHMLFRFLLPQSIGGDFSRPNPFRRCSRSKSEVVRNRT